VNRVALDCALPPERVLLALRGEPWPFALTGRWDGGRAIVGAAPREVVEDAAVRMPGGVGWFGYGASEPRPPRPVPLPDAHLAYYDHVLRLDDAGQWWFEVLADEGMERLDRVRELLAAAPEPRGPGIGTFTPRAPGTAGYAWAVGECVKRKLTREHLCLRLETAWDGDVAELYARAAPLLQPVFGACFVTPWGGVVSLSSERFPGRESRVVTELEATGREVYGGAIGFAGRELSLARRTFEARDGALWLTVGRDVTADSHPQVELEKCLAEAREVAVAAGAAIAAHPEAAPARAVTPALSRGRRRPDPSRGVFETILVRDGRPVNLEAHLRRLGARPALPELRGDGALRIAETVTFSPLKPRALPVVLTPYLLPGGLGDRKWRDRDLLDALSRDGTTPLLVDADGSVLEAAWAAVLIRRDGVLYTPREDGRILPSTSRPQAVQARLTLDDLERADELLLSSSLAGLVPAVLR
jgi:hypothetical protein